MPSTDTPNARRTAEHALLARPPTASTPLWAHILEPRTRPRAPTTLADMPATTAALCAPLDKNATSMRVLLHDTQAHLEKFSGHVRALAEGVKEAKHEIKTANGLFERDRECFVGDITDLVNRCQREIQKTVGTPAQDERIQSFLQNFTGHLSRLDQRLDALQTFNQTHSQALQTQMQAVQILLDKQGSIISAVLPLLPLLQALPLYIDAAKNSICENITKAFSEHLSVISKSGNVTACTPPSNGMLSVDTTAKRKRTDSHSAPSPLTEVPRKKSRNGGTDTSSLVSSSPHDDARRKTPARALSRRPAPSPPHVRTESSVARRTSAKDTNARTAPAPAPIVAQCRSASNAHTLATPRRPLSDLLPSFLPNAGLVTPRGAQGSGPAAPGHVDVSTLWPNMRTASSGAARTPALRKDNLRDHEHRPAPAVPAQTPRAASHVRSGALGLSARKDSMPIRNGLGLGLGRAQTLAQKALVVETPSAHLKHPTGGLPGRAVPATPALSGPGIPGDSSHFPLIPELILPNLADPDIRGDESSTVNVPVSSAWSSSVVPGVQRGIENLPLPAILGKERRSPVREKRRFIPLVDSEDEDEDEE